MSTETKNLYKTLYQVKNDSVISKEFLNRTNPDNWFPSKEDALEAHTTYLKNLKEKTDLFRKELKELLIKHNATISLEYDPCSDTQGMYDEELVAEITYEKATYTIPLSEGYYLEPSDL